MAAVDGQRHVAAAQKKRAEAMSPAAEGRIVSALLRAMRAKRTLYGRVVSGPRSFFDAADRDGSGRITLSELSEAFRRLGLDVPVAEMDKLLASIDVSGEGELDYSELRQWLRKDDDTEVNGFFEGCTVRLDGLEGELQEHHALVELLSHFGEVVVCDVVIPHGHDEEHAPWALVTFALSQAAALAKLFSAGMPPVDSLPADALASISTHLPEGRLKLEGLLKLLAANSWVHIRGVNRKRASHTKGRLAEVVHTHEKHLHQDAAEKVAAPQHTILLLQLIN